MLHSPEFKPKCLVLHFNLNRRVYFLQQPSHIFCIKILRKLFDILLLFYYYSFLLSLQIQGV